MGRSLGHVVHSSKVPDVLLGHQPPGGSGRLAPSKLGSTRVGRLWRSSRLEGGGEGFPRVPCSRLWSFRRNPRDASWLRRSRFPHWTLESERARPESAPARRCSRLELGSPAALNPVSHRPASCRYCSPIGGNTVVADLNVAVGFVRSLSGHLHILSGNVGSWQPARPPRTVSRRGREGRRPKTLRASRGVGCARTRAPQLAWR